MNFVNVNGTLTDTPIIPIDNGAFRYGYGLFETMLLLQGRIRLGALHWRRLFAGAAQLHLPLAKLINPAYLEEQVLRTAARNNMEELCRVRLQMYAGGGGIMEQQANAGFIIECYPLEPGSLALNENGLVTGLATGISKSADAVSNLKTCNALIYALAARQARENKWNDAVVCNTAGNIIESSIANIFVIKDGTIFTPPLSEGCVAGVMRRHIMDSLPPVQECAISRNMLLGADEVMLTNAIKGIRWVAGFETAVYENKAIKKLWPVVENC